MKSIIMLNPDGSKVVREMLSSCGNASCEVAVAQLALARVQVPLRDFVDKETGSWQKPVFGSLQAYALSEGLHELGAREVARYFGGKYHIEGMIRKASQSNLGFLMGLDAGLVLDVLLPLTDGHYRNGIWDLEMGEYVVANPKSNGTPCYHRGLVVNIDLEPEDVQSILEEQRNSEEFSEAMSRLTSPILLPPEFLEALCLNRT